MSDAYPGMEWTLKDIVIPAMEKEKLQTVQVHVDSGMKDGKGTKSTEGDDSGQT